MWKLCFRATCSKTLSSIRRLQSLKKKTGWMEKRKEARGSRGVGVLVTHGANENSAGVLLRLDVESAGVCWYTACTVLIG